MDNIKYDILWVEKYRPHTINKVIQQEDIKQLISSKNNLSNLPHLLFYGPPGTGKTTTALAICKYIFASNQIHSSKYSKILSERVLELNASDERGIKVVRDKIKSFASHALHIYEDIPNFKIIILDEADVMTNDSQFALRRIIEKYSHITRFILICNYVTKLIPPLSSRCSRYRFNAINICSMQTIIKNILVHEKVVYDSSSFEQIIQYIYNYSNGDLRKAITILQRIVYISNINNKLFSLELIKELTAKIPKEIINNLYLLLKSNFNNYNILVDELKSILNNSYSSSDILNDLANIILIDDKINDKLKVSIFIKISYISNLLVNGSCEYIQLIGLCSYINYLLSDKITSEL
jgi:replication factor C subunit 2/4